MKPLYSWDYWCWLAGAKKLAVIKKRPASLRWHLLGSVFWKHKEAVFHYDLASKIDSHRLSSWCQASISLHDPFSPWLSLRLNLYQWLSMASHSPEPQLLFMTPSCLQNQYHLGNSYTLPTPATAQGTTLAISGTQPLYSQKTLPRRCYLMMLVSS